MEVQNYEHLRNLTLLFFLEKLLDKGEDGRRSLHDLSCQFGTKGFSKEMRQIAGGSKVKKIYICSCSSNYSQPFPLLCTFLRLV